MTGPPEHGECHLDIQREPLPTNVDGLPDLPAECQRALEPALEILEAHGVHVGPAERDALADHLRLMLAWNEAINLTAIRDVLSAARLHVADSLAGIASLLTLPQATLLDIGSGGGFPGLVLAICMPNTRVTLVESVRKKAAFLETAVRAVGLADRVTVVARRAEDLAPGQWDIVTARAVGGLADLVEVGLPLLSNGGHLAVWKRGDLTAEFASAGRAAAVLGGSIPAWRPYPEDLTEVAGLAGHGIGLVRKVGNSPPGYPRDPGARKRRPW